MDIKKYSDPHENSGFWNSITHGVTELLSTATYSPDNLIIATEKKLEAMREIIDRDKTFWGALKTGLTARNLTAFWLTRYVDSAV